MQYIVHKRFKDRVIFGQANFPALTICEESNGLILYEGNPVCAISSENAHQYFARNDDGNGMLRGQLTQAIQKHLAKRDDNHQTRWDKVWEDEKCQQYKRKEYTDYWLWNHEFFNAEIDDLKYIAELIGAKISK